MSTVLSRVFTQQEFKKYSWILRCYLQSGFNIPDSDNVVAKRKDDMARISQEVLIKGYGIL